MQETLVRWLGDPTLAKLAASAIAIVVVAGLVRLTRRALGRVVRDPDSRYRSRKSVTFLGYVVAILVVGAIFSNQFGSLTVAFGVAGAGIAFALQEVIASVAGWHSIAATLSSVPAAQRQNWYLWARGRVLMKIDRLSRLWVRPGSC